MKKTLTERAAVLSFIVAILAVMLLTSFIAHTTEQAYAAPLRAAETFVGKPASSNIKSCGNSEATELRLRKLR